MLKLRQFEKQLSNNKLTMQLSSASQQQITSRRKNARGEKKQKKKCLLCSGEKELQHFRFLSDNILRPSDFLSEEIEENVSCNRDEKMDFL